MAMNGFPTVLRVTLGNAWNGTDGLSTSTVLDLIKAVDTSTQVVYSEDGTQTYASGTNRIMLTMTANSSFNGFSVHCASTGTSSFQQHIGVTTTTGTGSVYTFKDIFSNATPNFFSAFKTSYFSYAPTNLNAQVFSTMEAGPVNVDGTAIMSGTGHAESAGAKGGIADADVVGTGHAEAVSKVEKNFVFGAGTGHIEATGSKITDADSKATAQGHAEALGAKGVIGSGQLPAQGHSNAVGHKTIPKGGREISVNQPPHGAASDYPFVAPDDDIERILGELWLSYEDPECTYVLPLNVAWMYGFGPTPVAPPPGFPTPTHARDIIIRDALGTTVFDSTLAIGFAQVPFGSRLTTFEWKTEDEVLRVTQHTAISPGDPPLDHDDYIEPTSGELDSRTYQALPKRVKSIRVGLVKMRAENIIFDEGFNLAMAAGSVLSTPGGRRIQPIAFSANPGDGLGRLPACDEADALLRKVNNIGPNDSGNLKLDAGGCYRAQRLTRVTQEDPRQVEFYEDGLTTEEAAAALRISNDCGPCCTCEDFVNTYEGIRRLEAQYNDLGDQAEEVRDQYALNIDRWNVVRDCALATPIRMVVRQEYDCNVAFGISFCNLGDVCIHDIVLRLTLEGFKDGDPDPALNGTLLQCPDTIFSGTDTEYVEKPVQLDGDFPAYELPVAAADPGSAQKLQLRFDLNGCQPGQALCVTGTIQYVGGNSGVATDLFTGLPKGVRTIWEDGMLVSDNVRGFEQKCFPMLSVNKCH
jgi:hypothetical protein